MTNLERVQKIPEIYPNETDELNFLRAFVGAVAKATDLGYFRQELFEACMLAGHGIKK